MGAGSRRHPRHCSICGQTYILTNFMLRWVNPKTLEVATRRSERNDGYFTNHTDTHILAHWKRGEGSPPGAAAARTGGARHG